MANDDDNPRPTKRSRLEDFEAPPSSLSTLTDSPCSPNAIRVLEESPSRPKLRTIPPAALLASLPGLLAHPPNHKSYVVSLNLSLNALRKCLTLPALSPELECRAWTGLAELGMRIIASGLSQHDDHLWARGIEAEVDKALSKGGIIAQKHPSLRPFKLHISLLQVQFSHWQHRSKFARSQIRNLLSSFLPTDPPYLVYSAHLAAISLFTTPQPARNQTARLNLATPLIPSAASSPGQTKNAQDIHAALSAVQIMESLSLQHKHIRVTLLSHILRLRILVAACIWSDVPAVLQRAETALGLSYLPSATPRPGTGTSTPNGSKGREGSARDDTSFITFEDPMEAAMAVHLLMMAVVFYTHMGRATEVSPRLSHLHALLDSGVLSKFREGVVHVDLAKGPPLIVQVTHPRVLFLLAFLVTSVAKRDAVGRRPKRKVFANEGLSIWDREVAREVFVPIWSSLGDVEEIEQRLARIKADLMCELVAVSTMRSEFDEADTHLSQLVAHTRTYRIFPFFAARITLHHAHLAHALGKPVRALQCYDVAAKLSDDGDFVNLSARAGRILLKLGMEVEAHGDEDEEAEEEERQCVADACKRVGGTLEAVGHVLEACLSSEIMKSKQHLKSALQLATDSQDNHLRALVLALISSQYFYTAGDHAQKMLQTCEQLAAGLGAPPSKPSASTGAGESVVFGNIPLGLWIGERFLELYKRAGKTSRVEKQAAANAHYEKAYEALKTRGVALTAEV